MAVVLVWTGLAGAACAVEDAAWAAFDKADSELRAVEGDLGLCNEALDVCREGVAARSGGEIKALRKAVESAQKAVDEAKAQGDLGAAEAAMKAAREARDAKVESLIGDFAPFIEAKARRDTLTKKIEEMTGRIGKLSADEAEELVRMRREQRQLDKHLYGSLRAWWSRGEVAAEFQAADAAYKACGEVSKGSAALNEASARLKAAQKALGEAVAALPPKGKAAEALLARKTDLDAKVAELKGTVGKLEKQLVGDGKDVTIVVKGVDRKTKKEVDEKVSLWLPPGHETIRGVIVAHPMVKGLATSRPTRLAAAREGLGMMVFGDIPGDPKAAVAKFDDLFEKFAEASGHPELRGAPIMLGGLSASVLATRNVACVAPERVFGIVHVAGGNMQEMPDGGAGMVEVPFLAHNGEFEWCGPVGGGHASGKFGIRPEYGNQTQWVMIREQMLRLWRGKHRHRMSFVVVPNADHGAWDVDLTALFIRKCAQYRLPTEKRDGSRPAVCRSLPAEQGWLTDADLDHPKFEPAAYGEYKGDKDNVFWHFDEEMAQAVYVYEKGRFLLPDPTKVSPVPADWPPVKN